MKLNEKVAIVTGSSKGIGENIALAFAKEGAKVALVGRNKENLDKVAEEIDLLGAECIIIPTDITHQEDVLKMVNETKNKFGKIDILINNAGIGLFKPVLEITLDDWLQVMEVNAMGTFLCTKAVLPVMQQYNTGWIINICSDAGRRTFPRGSLYCASKYAQYAFAQAVSQEVRGTGIHVGSILPGNVDTCFAGSTQGTEGKQWMLKPSDIANAVLYMVTQGDTVVVDEITVHPIHQDY